jgi:hypothetical protein
MQQLQGGVPFLGAIVRADPRRLDTLYARLRRCQ